MQTIVDELSDPKYRDVVRKPNPPNHNPNQLKNKPQPQKVRSLNIAKISSTLKHLPTIYDKLKKLYAEHKKLLLHEFIEISGLLNHLTLGGPVGYLYLEGPF